MDLLSRTPHRPVIMGIVNATPDSFSDGGDAFGVDAGVSHALQLIEDGADIVDIGGESTRPPGKSYGAGSSTIDAAEEIRRVVPIIERIHHLRPDAIVSIDTMKPAVAIAAIGAGATIINDVSAGRYDESIWQVAAEADVPYILMHGHDPRHRRAVEEVVYSDVVDDVYDFLKERIARARAAGVGEIVADVGIGFEKGSTENIELLRRHAEFRGLGVPLLVGASRKAFIGSLIGGAAPKERTIGTLGAHAAAWMHGAQIVRVHDVRATREFFSVFGTLIEQPNDGFPGSRGNDDGNRGLP